jgi:hypothetical protein
LRINNNRKDLPLSGDRGIQQTHKPKQNNKQMSINVVTQPQQTVSLSAVELLGVRDLFAEKAIIARVKGLPRPVVLWKGDAEYAAAGVWTNETATAQAATVLSLSAIPWA